MKHIFCITCLCLAFTERGDNPRAGTRFAEELIADGYGYAFAVAAADLDADGDLDLTSGDTDKGDFYWFENNGKGKLQKHVVRQGEPGWFERHAIGDINGDKRPDIAIVKNLDGHLVWFEHGGQPKETGNWIRDAAETHQIAWYENVGSPGSGTGWKKHVVGSLDDAFEAIAGDVDGDLDVAATGWGDPGRVAWFENAGDPKGAWKKHVLKEAWRRANQIILFDADGDKRFDLAATAERGTNELRLWRNVGK